MNKIKTKKGIALKAAGLFAAVLLASAVFAGTISVQYGYVNNASDGTAALSSNVRLYMTARTTEVLRTTVQEAGGLIYWLIDASNFPTPWAVNDDQVVVIEKETGAGTAAHKGYFAVTNFDAQGSDQFNNTTIREIPVPAATAGDAQVTLNWAAAVGDNGVPVRNNIAGYNVFRSTNQASGFTQVNGALITSTNYTDASVFNGITYYYVLQLVYRATAGTNPTSEVYSANSNAATPSSGATPTFVSATPSSAYSGNTLNVDIVGLNTNFATGFTTANFGAGITVNLPVTVTDATHCRANITIPAGAAPGARTITVTTNTETITGTNAFTVLAPSVSLSPNNGNQGTVVTVTLTGTGTHFNNGITTASVSGTNVTAGVVTVTSTTAATVNLTIGAGAATGGRTVTLSTALGGALGTENVANTFTVNAAGVPTFVSATPSSAYSGNTLNVDIVGLNTNFAGGVTTANFGAGITVNLPVTVTDPTHCTANITIPAGTAAGARNITVTTNAEVITGTNAFTVLSPSVSLSPNNGNQGTTVTVTLTGTGTHFNNGITTASVSGTNVTAGPVTVTGTTTATVNLTIGAGAAVGGRTLTLTTALGGALGTENVSNTFTVNTPATYVIIDDYDVPHAGDLRGKMDYYYQSDGTGVPMPSVNIPAPVNSADRHEGSYSMQTTYVGAPTAWGGYWGGGLTTEVKDGSSFNGISLWVKGDGTANTIRLDLLEPMATGEVYSSFPISLSDTTWHEVQIPFVSFTRNNDAGNVKDDNIFSRKIKGYTFIYLGSAPNAVSVSNYVDYIIATNVAGPAAPTVIRLLPNIGPVGTVFTIEGTNLGGATSVTMGVNPVTSFSVMSSTRITAVVPVGTPLGAHHVTVTTPGGTSATTPADIFTVVSAMSVIDNYEDNGKTDVNGLMDYYYDSGAGAGEVNIPAPAYTLGAQYEGSRSMNLTYPGAGGGFWGGFWGGGLSNPAVDAVNVSACNMLIYTVKGDNTPANTLRVGVTENTGNAANDEPFTSLDNYFIGSSASFVMNKVPFSRMWRDEYTGSIKADNTFTKSVKSYTFAYGGADVTATNHQVDFLAAIAWAGPIIDLIGPNYGPVGTSVTVIGSNFGAIQGTSVLTFNGTTASITSWSDTRIVTTVPAGATSGPVVVTVNSMASNGVMFTVGSVTGPVITTIVPNQGPSGTAIVINGTGFGGDPGAGNRSTAANHIVFSINKIVDANVTSWSDTAIAMTVPALPDGVYPVQVRASNMESNFVDFTIGPLTSGTISGLTIVRAADAAGSGVTLTWSTAPAGLNVDIWTRTGAFTTNTASWTKEQSNFVPKNWTDANQVGTGTQKYYKLMPAGAILASSDLTQEVAGKFDITCTGATAAKYYMISTPLVLTASAIDSAIGNQLTGGALLPLADQIFKYNGSGFDTAWISTAGSWKDTSGAASAMTIDPDIAYWVRIAASHGTKNITLVGKISNPAARTGKTISANYNQVGSCYPVSAALSVSGLSASGATRGALMPLACQVIKYDPVSESYDTAWLNTAGQWKNTAGADSTMQLDPGAGYWIKEVSTSGGYTWTYPKPF